MKLTHELERWTAQSPRHLMTLVDYFALEVMLSMKESPPREPS